MSLPLLAPPLTLNGWLRYDLVRRLLRPLEGIESVLEIGAGEGALGWRLARRYRYTGVEPDPLSFAQAHRRLSPLSSARVLSLTVEELDPEEVFDLVCAFEVLEHIEDDAAALCLWTRRVRPGGYLLLSVPAWQSRWGALDEKAGHFRRYDPARLKELLRTVGLEQPNLLLYGFPLGYVLQPLWNLAARPAARKGSMADKTRASGHWLQPPDAAGILTQLASAPFRLIQRPFVRTMLGTGIVAFSRRATEWG